MARLLETLEIIHGRGGRVDIEEPMFLFVQWQQIIAGYEQKSLRAESWVKIPRQKKRILRPRRQQRTETICAKAVGIPAVSRRDTQGKAVLQIRQCVGQKSLAPEQMGMRPH